MRAWRWMVGLCVAIGLGALAWVAVVTFFPEAYIDVDQQQLQARLEARFPRKNCTMMVACITLSAPAVTLAEGSERIAMSADVLVAVGKREASGKVAFSGTVRYVRYAGDFFLDDVQVDDFALDGVPPELVELVKSKGPAAIRRALEGHPIYTIKSDSARSALAKLAVRDVRVVHGKLRVSFLRFGG
jgi:hypothetical protein